MRSEGLTKEGGTVTNQRLGTSMEYRVVGAATTLRRPPWPQSDIGQKKETKMKRVCTVQLSAACKSPQRLRLPFGS